MIYSDNLLNDVYIVFFYDDLRYITYDFYVMSCNYGFINDLKMKFLDRIFDMFQYESRSISFTGQL